jgi:hypothetical protein
MSKSRFICSFFLWNLFWILRKWHLDYLQDGASTELLDAFNSASWMLVIWRYFDGFERAHGVKDHNGLFAVFVFGVSELGFL